MKKYLLVGTLCLCFTLSACKDAPKSEQNATQAQKHHHKTDVEGKAMSNHSCAHHGDKNGTHQCQHNRDSNATHQCGGHKGHGGHGMHKFSDTESGKMMSAMHEPMIKQKPSHSGSVEIDFIADMIPHHQGAINSAKLVLAHAKDNAKLETLAHNIINSQEKEIAEFNDLLKGNKLSKTEINESAYKQFRRANKQAMRKMMKGMGIEESGNIQKDFLVAMIAHHQGAIDVSKIVLECSKDEKVRQIAQNIINAQEVEITQMKSMIQELK